LMVVSLCAIETTHPSISFSMLSSAACTIFSFFESSALVSTIHTMHYTLYTMHYTFESSALVASSNSKIVGLRMIARAMATR
jgi:hypothetical protein